MDKCGMETGDALPGGSGMDAMNLQGVNFDPSYGNANPDEKSPIPTQEELMEKLKVTEAIVKQQKQSLEEKDDEIKRLRGMYNQAKQMFQAQWEDRRWEWRDMIVQSAELRKLTEKENGLLETAHGLKDALVKISSEGGLKLDEIRKLTRKVDELKNGKKIKPTGTSLSNAVGKGAGRMGRNPAAAIFPEEIWRAILGYVSDPKDLWNLTNTCQLFDNILSKWKTGWMLGQTLPYLYRHLPSKKLLECRLVCKSWEAAVDCFLEESPSLRPHDPDNIDPRRLDFVNPMKEKGFKITWGKKINFCSGENAATLEDPDIPIPAVAGRSPFPGRFVCLDLFHYEPSEDKVDEDIEKLVEKARKFLTSFGGEVWYLKVWFPWNDEVGIHPRIAQFVTFEMSRLLPNLRELVMGNHFWDPSRLPPSDSIPPAWPKLETLVAYRRSHFDLELEVRVAKYHAQLHKVCVTGSPGPLALAQFCHLEWPNLRELLLKGVRDLNDFRRLCNVRMPQLSRLGLCLNHITGRATLDHLLVTIRHLCSTSSVLDTIRLYGGPYNLRLGRLKHQDYCAPSSIKTLEIEHESSFGIPNYTFLLQYFPVIENVHLFLQKYDSYESDIDLRDGEACLNNSLGEGFQEGFEIVEVNRYLHGRQMYRSNIWKLLHNLKVFTFQWDVYTRAGWEEYQEKRENWNSD